jgi:RHS repeat-associated protein
MKLRKPRTRTRVRQFNLNATPTLHQLEDRSVPGSVLELLGQPLLLRPDALIFGDDLLIPVGRSTGPARPWKATDHWTADEPARRGVTPPGTMTHFLAYGNQERWNPGSSAQNGNREGWSGTQALAGLRLGDAIGLDRDLLDGLLAFGGSSASAPTPGQASAGGGAGAGSDGLLSASATAGGLGADVPAPRPHGLIRPFEGGDANAIIGSSFGTVGPLTVSPARQTDASATSDGSTGSQDGGFGLASVTAFSSGTQSGMSGGLFSGGLSGGEFSFFGPLNLEGPSGDPLWVLDANDAIVVTPGVVEHEFSGWSVDLRAQVSGAAVSSYSWDLSEAPDAVNVTGQNSYRLQFKWASFQGPARTNTIRITTTNADSTQFTQTLAFQVAGTQVASDLGYIGGGSGGSGGSYTGPTSASTWPTVVTPDAVTSRQEVVGGPNYSLGLATGEVQTGHTLPAYNPGVPPHQLVYSSTAADPRPIFLTRYTLDPSQAVPATVSAQLTLNGVAGPTVYYDTALLNPGGVLQIALQGDATALPTGRYSYQIAVTAHYPTPVTTNYSGQVTIVNSASSPFGAGWSLAGVERLRPVTGGMILESPGGISLWFADGQQSGTFVTPAGDFSTLVRNPDNTYTRTLKDGTKVHFDSAGRQTAVVDRNNNTTGFSYDGSGRLTAVTDPNGLATQLAYGGNGRVSTITDPAGRVTQLGYDGSGRLTSITDPDPDGAGPLASPVWSYAYDTANRLTSLTDPRSKTTTFAYNFAGRAATATRPDGTTEQLTALQLQGLAVPPSGSQSNPAAPVLAVEALADYTDPRGNAWQTRLDWLGFGQASQAADPLGDMAVVHRNANGLAWMGADPLGRRAVSAFDSKGNPTKTYLPDDNTQQFTYNGFSQVTQATDPLGRTTTYAYDSNGNLTSITRPDPDGAGPLTAPVTGFTYTADGLVGSTTDPLGRVTLYAYDALDRLTQVTYPDGDGDPNNNPKVLFAYDAAGNLTGRTDERGFVTAFSYDNLNRLTRTTLPDGDADPNNNPKYTYAYDAAGNQTSVTDPLNHTTSSAYDNLNRLTSTTNALNFTTSYGYDAAGNLTSVTNPLGHQTLYAYDAAGRRTGVTDPLNHTTTYAYDAAGQLASQTDPLGRTTDYAYTVRGWLAGVTDPLGNQSAFAYDAAGNRLAAAQQGSGGGTWGYAYDALDRLIRYTDPLGQTTGYAYDAAGNRTAVTDPLGHTTGYAYDARDRLVSVTDPLGQTTGYGYDAAGNRTSVTDPLNRTTLSAYDPQNRLVSTTDPLSGVTGYAYDLAGRLTSITDPVGNVWQYAYDAADRLTGVTDPLSHATLYAYDAADRLTGVTNRNGRQRTFGYDAAGRRTAETWLNGQGQPIYTASFGYDAAGQLVSASDPHSAYAYGYDAAGRLTSVNNAGTPGVPNVILGYNYDAAGKRTGLSDGLGGSVAYGYDAAQRLSQVSLTVSGNPGPQVGFGYDAASRLTGITRQVSGQSGSVNSAFSYDNADRLIGITHGYSPGGSGGSTLSSFSYGYDAAGQLTSYTGPEGTVNFNYDATSQLTGASGARSEGYSYDANGNRTMTGYQTGGGNRLTSDGTYNYTYDNEGNPLTKTRISDGRRTEFVWDYRNRLSGVVVKDASGTVLQETVFTYDVSDRRIGKRVDPDGPGPQAAVQLWTVYDGVNPYADFDGSGSLTMRYLADPNQPDALFARVAANGTTAWYLRDNINSVRQVVSPTGTVLNAITYDSFGKVLNETNPADGDRFKYTGREYDAELGIYYYRARYYDPATGRFLGEDPKGFGAGDANLYRYVGNQPTGRIDPMGLDWAETVAGWIGVDNVRSWDNYLGDYRTGWFAKASNFSAGYADTLSFGLTSYARGWMGYDNVVDHRSGWYHGGEAFGLLHSIAIGGAWRSARAPNLAMGMSRPNPAFPRGIEWVERSHWIPNRYLPQWLSWQRWNLKLMWGSEHALIDPFRYRMMPRWWKAANPMPPWYVQQWRRVPYWAQGSLGGLGYGGASIGVNSLFRPPSPWPQE